MPEHLGETNQHKVKEGDNSMMSEEDQKFIENLVKTEGGLDQLVNEGAILIREVLANVVRDYIVQKRTPTEIQNILKKKRKYLVKDLKDILKRYDFTLENISERAAHIAKILEDDIELETDATAAEEEEYKRQEPVHRDDDRGRPFFQIISQHPKFGNVLEIMVDEPEKLASLVPASEKEEYLARFDGLLHEYLLAKRKGEDWEVTPEAEKFLIEYVFRFAHEFLRTDVKKKKPA